jgi:hypothetical protein
MFDPQARERAGLHLSTTTTTTIGGVGGCASVEEDVVVFPSLDSFLFFSSSTSKSREGVARVESKRGEAQIVVVVVDAVGAVCGSLP